MNWNDFVRKGKRWAYVRLYQSHAVVRSHRRYVQRVQERGKTRVVILAMSVPMWKYQHLYEILAADERFDVNIVISPTIAYEEEQRQQDVRALRAYFEKRNTPYIDFDIENGSAPFDIKTQLDPDIIFYPQPYEHLLVPEHDCLAFYDRLVCYYPYAFMSGEDKLTYNFHFHNLAWRLYYTNEEIRQVAQRLMRNGAVNVRVVGYPNADDYARAHFEDVWKPMADGRPRKRIIWAPHFSIWNEFGRIARSNFIWMAHFMLDLAQRYKEHIQIAFKPHPRLLTELYRHSEWGRERTDAYYKMWSEMDNTQLETGEFIDLFMTSDALIHDCASFVVEYNYTHRPVLFMSRELDVLLRGETEFSQKAFRVLYHGKDEREVLDFVDNVVLGGEDFMLPQREAFYNQNLNPPHGTTVAQNTLNDLVKSLGL